MTSSSARQAGTTWGNGLKPLATIDFGSTSYVFYVGLRALALNIGVAAIVTVLVGLVSTKPQSALRNAT
jgi:SSS family solute:Na+ symporter